MKKQIAFPLVIWLFFMTIAVSLGLTIHLFYLFNSCYARTLLSPMLKADNNSIALFNDAM
jgi:hypothetical protein